MQKKGQEGNKAAASRSAQRGHRGRDCGSLDNGVKSVTGTALEESGSLCGPLDKTGRQHICFSSGGGPERCRGSRVSKCLRDISWIGRSNPGFYGVRSTRSCSRRMNVQFFFLLNAGFAVCFMATWDLLKLQRGRDASHFIPQYQQGG